MKKWIFLLLLPVFLTGCGVEETLETVMDVWSVPEAPPARQIRIDLPGETSVNTLQSDSGQLYICDGYEISVETMDAGDLEKTIQSLSGRKPEELTVMETERDGVRRYEFVWAAAGEQGDRLGRSVILDDGNYHYTLTILRDAGLEKNSQIIWNDVFRSFSLA